MIRPSAVKNTRNLGVPPPSSQPTPSRIAHITPNSAAVFSPLKCWWPIVSPSLVCTVKRARFRAGSLVSLPHVPTLRHPECAVRLARWTTLAAVVALALAACAPTDDSTGDAPSDSVGGLETLEADVLTIATSDPAYEPWVVDNDPTSGKGFESAVAFAVADQLGFDKDHVKWVTASFDQIIAPGAKDFDFAINQVSISDERKASLDFSSPYYTTAQAVVTLETSAAADAASLADLKPL